MKVAMFSHLYDAVHGHLMFNSTKRSAKCYFLVLAAICVNCSRLRRFLRERKYRRDKRKESNGEHSLSQSVSGLCWKKVHTTS